MDGLLIDSERLMWIPNELKTLEELGYEADASFLNTLMGGAPKTNQEKYYKRYGKDFDLDYFYKLVNEYNRISVENNEVPLKDGAIELLDYLKENNIKICVGSSSAKDYAYQVLKKLNVFDRFDYVITRSDVENAKPYPDIYLKCMSYFDFDKDECLVLEDAHSGLLAAKAAGCRCILVPDLGVLSKEDLNNAYKVLNNLKDVIDVIKEENERASSI